MAVTRRDFIRTGAIIAAGAASGADLLASAGARLPKAYFALHPFIQKNPKAVFICRTGVREKMDQPAKLREGLKLAREIFVPADTPGIPVSHRIVLKPNATGVYARRVEDVWGVGTDPSFYEGVITGLQELGVKKLTMVDSTPYDTWVIRGMIDVNARRGVEWNESRNRERHLRDEFNINWHDVPDGVVFNRIPHYAPVGEPDTWLLNIAKWKSHSMVLTQTIKNEQGLVAHPFTAFCGGWRSLQGDVMKTGVNPRVEQLVNGFLAEHRKTYSRYRSKGNTQLRASIDPVVQEIWAQKTCDNQSTLKTGFSMIEAITGRDGDGFSVGQDYLTNMVIFGQDKWRLDLVGLYLGGHEPGNVHVYRIAKERGLSDTFNPWDVELYDWADGRPVRRTLTDFQRFELRTAHLPLEGEPDYHLVNEPFDYDRIKT